MISGASEGVEEDEHTSKGVRGTKEEMNHVSNGEEGCQRHCLS